MVIKKHFTVILVALNSVVPVWHTHRDDSAHIDAVLVCYNMNHYS